MNISYNLRYVNILCISTCGKACWQIIWEESTNQQPMKLPGTMQEYILQSIFYSAPRIEMQHCASNWANYG